VLDGKLNALVGGRAEDVARAMPVLEKMTASVRHMGKLGNGCAMKLAINMGMVAYMQTIAEALALGQQQGLTIDQMLEVMSVAPTASGWLKGKTPILKGEGGPISLDLKTMRKDIISAVATGALTGVPMPMASGALSSISAAVGAGWGDLDIAELPRFFRENMLQNYGQPAKN
jgi:3-hydroxyisobutyrate dehydrogenase-like beta-hydroxyacid dehydrogenase